MRSFIVLWSWMCDNPELAAGFLTSLVLLIGLLVAYKQLKLLKRTHQAGLIKNMSEYWDSQIMREGREALWEIQAKAEALSKELERCKKEDFERWLTLTRVGNFFEEMGNLAHGKAVDLRIIAGRFRSHIEDYYELYEPFIEDRRPTEKAIYEYFEWLAKKIKKIKM